MKNWKQLKVMPLLAVFGIIIGIMACDNDNSKNAHIHDWGEWIETKAPTVTEEGEETRTCKIDPSHTQTRPVAPLPTPYLGTWKNVGDIMNWGEDNTVIISESTINFQIQPGDLDIVFTILAWTAHYNTDDNTKDEYPKGVHLTTSNEGSYGNDFWIYMHKTDPTKHINYLYNDQGNNYNYFTKQ